MCFFVCLKGIMVPWFHCHSEFWISFEGWVVIIRSDLVCVTLLSRYFLFLVRNPFRLDMYIPFSDPFPLVWFSVPLHIFLISLALDMWVFKPWSRLISTKISDAAKNGYVVESPGSVFCLHFAWSLLSIYHCWQTSETRFSSVIDPIPGVPLPHCPSYLLL